MSTFRLELVRSVVAERPQQGISTGGSQLTFANMELGIWNDNIFFYCRRT